MSAGPSGWKDRHKERRGRRRVREGACEGQRRERLNSEREREGGQRKQRVKTKKVSKEET